MKKRLICTIVLLLLVVFSLSACRESDRVSYNVSKEADNFNVSRRFVAINTRTDKPLLEIIGNFAILNSNHHEIEVVVEVAEDVYKKHYVYLNEWVTYTVEDISGANVTPYHYEVNYLPEMIPTFEFTSNK